MKTALTIAGSDPTGGAGLQADIKVFRSFGVHGLAAVSVITAQNSEGVSAVFPVAEDSLETQLRVLLSDIRPAALKTGMLYSTWTPAVIAKMMNEYSLSSLVIDPVTVSSSGAGLAEDGTLDALRATLFPLCRVVTPNIYEASVLTGITIEEKRGMEEAAKSLKAMGPGVVIITGGHLEDMALDLYYDGEFHAIAGEKFKGEYHGTGCAFSAALTALLALGHAPLEAARQAKEFVNQAIKKSYHPGRGMGLLSL